MRISDWSSDVCSSDLKATDLGRAFGRSPVPVGEELRPEIVLVPARDRVLDQFACGAEQVGGYGGGLRHRHLGIAGQQAKHAVLLDMRPRQEGWPGIGRAHV